MSSAQFFILLVYLLLCSCTIFAISTALRSSGQNSYGHQSSSTMSQSRQLCSKLLSAHELHGDWVQGASDIQVTYIFPFPKELEATCKGCQHSSNYTEQRRGSASRRIFGARGPLSNALMWHWCLITCQLTPGGVSNMGTGD